MPTIVAFDPGLEGGMAWLEWQQMNAMPMPILGGDIDVITIADKLVWLERTFGKVDLIIFEKAQPMPKQGVTSVFNYGRGYGKLLGLAEAMRIRYEEVRPTEWKKVTLAGTKKDKDAAIKLAVTRHPHLRQADWMGKRKKFPDGVADAVCLVEYGLYYYTSRMGGMNGSPNDPGAGKDLRREKVHAAGDRGAVS